MAKLPDPPAGSAAGAGRNADQSAQVSDEVRREEVRREVERRVSHMPGISPEVRGQIVSETTQLTAQFSGPIPPGFVLQEYEQLQPGAADRIIAMAEREQAHAHDIERRSHLYPFVAELCGKVSGTLVTMFGIGASA